MTPDWVSIAKKIDVVESAEMSRKGRLICNVRAGENTWKIGISVEYPIRRLPTVVLEDVYDLQLIPHVCWEGVICYSTNQGVSIDFETPEFILASVLSDVVKILSEGDQPWDENPHLADAFFSEFEGYWNKQKNCLSVDVLVGQLDRVAHANVYIRPDLEMSTTGAIYTVISRQHESPLNHLFKGAVLGESPVHWPDALIIPLSERVRPPEMAEELDAECVTRILEKVPTKDRRKCSALFKKRSAKGRSLILIFQMPRLKSEYSMFGIIVGAKCVWNGLKLKSAEFLRPLVVKRQTKEHLLRRAGGIPSLQNKHVAVVGCGSVGGAIGVLLAKSGVGEITFFDDDYLTSENLHRHVLGVPWIGKSKAIAMAAELEARLPYVKSHAVNERYNGTAESDWCFDAVVLAIGEPTIERAINEQYVQRRKNGPVPILVTTWLEAKGVAGHAVSINGQSAGCLSCLYHWENEFQLFPVTSIISPDEVTATNLTGCGGTFTPFGAIDAEKTAAVASRLVLRQLNKVTDHAEYDCWWERDVVATGVKVRDIRMSGPMDDFAHSATAHIAEGCPTCRL